MKVLFVSSGNSLTGISPIVERQGRSLSQSGLEVSYFTIKGKGLKGYLTSIFKLRTYLKENKVDIIHAHYALCGYVALFASKKQKLILSFMGSDILSGNRLVSKMNSWVAKQFFHKVILKSDDMKKVLGETDKAVVIPNGVDLTTFSYEPQAVAQHKLNFDPAKRHILFVANPNRPEKNFSLAKEAFSLLDPSVYTFHTVYNLSTEKLVMHYNAADLILMTSVYEGSPNVIKEAMACNCPVVSTKVGDVEKLLTGVPGCFVVESNPNTIKAAIIKAVEFRKSDVQTKGRERLIQSGLSSEKVAEHLIQVYNSIAD